MDLLSALPFLVALETDAAKAIGAAIAMGVGGLGPALAIGNRENSAARFDPPHIARDEGIRIGSEDVVLDRKPRLPPDEVTHLLEPFRREASTVRAAGRKNVITIATISTTDTGRDSMYSKT